MANRDGPIERNPFGVVPGRCTGPLAAVCCLIETTSNAGRSPAGIAPNKTATAAANRSSGQIFIGGQATVAIFIERLEGHG